MLARPILSGSTFAVQETLPLKHVGARLGADLEAGVCQPLSQLPVMLDDAAQLAAYQVTRQHML